MTKHWAFDLIGQHWPRFGCWSFVQHACQIRLGVAMPELASMDAIREAWVPRADNPTEGDVVSMRGPKGRHAGVMTVANGRLGVLHADTIVAFETLDDLRRSGYGTFVFWGRA